ncbi:6-phosphogluconolactonase [Nitrospina watsonii]|uniref:6-phosphogluconolactonase n=1 Tax=Nitrospina watsonii TaxID=1323948 RepID=A0ABM9HBH3_9BACT|nr:6-phosphogluconolactonase [Nitrospina watsonii]CAI2717465.1 6-phosphogluconolactonase [Nitrospina watsonii]
MRSPEARLFVHADAEQLADALTLEWVRRVQAAASLNAPFRVALPGGSTPRRLLERLALPQYAKEIDWSGVHVFFGDERCVPPGHADSNYHMVHEALLRHVPIPTGNVHCMRGEDDPYGEAARYTEELRRTFGIAASQVPRFDWILLGVGTDGHTASLFPGQNETLACRDWCTVAHHPDSGQPRITLTLPVLNHAACVSFLVTGLDKADALAAVKNDPERRQRFPAACVEAEQVEWWVDEAAASRL